LDKVLVDHIGNKYERKNKYLIEVIDLKEKIKETKDSDAKEALQELKKNKKKHAYNLDLAKFQDAEKAFKAKLKNEVSAFKTKNKGQTSRLLGLEVRLLKATKKIEFYSNYQELTWEAAYQHNYAVVEAGQLPDIIQYYKKTKQELDDALTRKKNFNSSEDASALKDLEVVKKDAKEKYTRQLGESKAKLKEKLISKTAFENSKKQFKRELSETVSITKYKVPSKSISESIRISRIELDKGVKKLEKILEANLHEVRRMTPSEKTSFNQLNAYIGFLLPGLGQLLNQQYVKGALFAIVSLYTYMMAIPYALGYGNYQGDGISGLVDLANSGAKLDKSIIFMIEGIIAIFLLIIALALVLMVFFDAKKVAKERRQGVRVRLWSETRKSFLENGFPFIVTSPALLFTIFIVFVPICTTILLSFTSMDPYNQAKFTWLGFDNYSILLRGEGVAGGAFWEIFNWTVIWTLGATTFAIAIGFFLAIMVNNERIKGKAIFRAIYLLPWAVPAFISIMFFSMMFGTEGALTKIITDLFSSDGAKILVKQDTNLTRLVLVMLQGWLGSAYVFLLSTGVLQAIPNDLYEAAQIDGASGWQKLSTITVPIVLFQTAPLLVGQYTFNFNNFSIIYLFNGGGPFNPTKYGNLAGSSDLLISYIYKLTIENQYQALGAAVTLIISLGLMFFAYIGFKNSKAFKEEQL
jgi:arabinogalactan oligomer/maltooligosaccharide transport system permease protein